MEPRKLLDEMKAELERHYGQKLAGVVLYGSLARGEDSPDSDVDLIVLLEGKFSLTRETRRIIDALYPLLQRRNLTRSLHPIPVKHDEYKAGRLSLYRVAQSEGLAA